MLASFIRLYLRFPRRRHLTGEHVVGVQGEHAAVRRLRRGELHWQRGAVAGSGAAAATRGAQAHVDVAGARGEEPISTRKEMEERRWRWGEFREVGVVSQAL